MHALSGLPRRRYDWETVRRRYVEGLEDPEHGRVWSSLNESADHFGITRQRVQEQSSRHGWVRQRDAFRQRVAEAVIAAKAQALAARRIDVDTAAADAAEHGIALVRARLGEVDTDRNSRAVAKAAYDTLKARGDASPEELDETGYSPWMTSPVDARELQALAAALSNLHQVGVRATGGELAPKVELSGGLELRGSVRDELGMDDVDPLLALMKTMEQVRFGEIVDADVVENEGASNPGRTPSP